MDGLVTSRVIAEVKRMLSDKDYREAMVEHNFRLAKRNYGYTTLRRSLRTLMTQLTGSV